MTTDEIKNLATEYGFCCRYEADENICDKARLKLYSAIDEMVESERKRCSMVCVTMRQTVKNIDYKLACTDCDVMIRRGE